MKKIFALILVLCMVLSVAGCGSSAPAAPAAPAAKPAAPSFVPEDIDTPVAAAKQPTRSGDMADIDEIFSIFKR